jgi:hypothetical protein
MHEVQQLLGAPGRAALLAFALAACSAPAAARRQPPATPATPATPAAPPIAPVPSAASEPPVATTSTLADAPDPREDPRPLLVVMPSGDAHLILGSAPSRHDDHVVWDVVYLADGGAAAQGDPGERGQRAAIARDLLDAFRLLAEVAASDRLSVTAVLGKPGVRGDAEQYRFERRGQEWRAEGAPSWFTVPRVPLIVPDVVRDHDAEDRAREAAIAFLLDADRADYDAAWERTSPLAKAVMSRAEFERRLASSGGARPVGTAPYLAFPAPASPFLPGAFIEAWITRESPRGASVETLTMRLDDDMEWRVAGVAKLTKARPPVAASGADGGVEQAAARSPEAP